MSAPGSEPFKWNLWPEAPKVCAICGLELRIKDVRRHETRCVKRQGPAGVVLLRRARPFTASAGRANVPTIPGRSEDMTVTDIDFAGRIAERQLEIPGMDGYTAEKLAVTLSGGVEFTDVTQADDVAFVKSLKLGQEVRLTVTATVTKNGYSLALGRDELTDDKLAYGVGLKVHSVEVA